MSPTPRIPRFVWRMMSYLNQGMLSRYGSKSKVASRVLVLTTTGRKSGLPRSTPLQYEQVEGVYYVASARGTHADWYRNLQANSHVEVQVGESHFSAVAELITNPAQIADFLEIRIRRHPHFMSVMLRIEGLPRKHTRSELEKFSKRLAVVALQQPNLQA